jgi:hypothetical protein
MKSLYLLLIVSVTTLFSANKLHAQINPAAAMNLKKQADQMAHDFSNRDYAAFTKYTYPKVVQMVGGEAKMVVVIKGQVDKWSKDGISISSVSVGEATKIVKAGNELHSIINQKLVLKVPGGTMTKNSYLLAISGNNGVKWYFIDSAPFNKDNLKKMFPNFNSALVIPAKEEPVFTPTN